MDRKVNIAGLVIKLKVALLDVLLFQCMNGYYAISHMNHTLACLLKVTLNSYCYLVPLVSGGHSEDVNLASKVIQRNAYLPYFPPLCLFYWLPLPLNWVSRFHSDLSLNGLFCRCFDAKHRMVSQYFA